MKIQGHDKGRTLAHLAGMAIGLLVLAYLLKVVYTDTIAPTFGYIGERARPVRLAEGGIALAAAWLVGVLLPPTVRDVGDFSLWVLYILIGVPVILVPQFADLCTPSQALQLAAITCVTFPLIVLVVRHGPHDLVPLHPLSPTSFWMGTGVITLAGYAYLFAVTGVKFAAPSITDVYDLRTQYRLLLSDNSALLGYDIRLLGIILNPLYMAQGLYSRRGWLVALGMFGQLIIYSVTGYKLTLLSGAAILLVSAYFKYARSRAASTILYGIAAIALICLFVDRARESITLTTVFVYRLIIGSGTLAAVYIDFFSLNPKVHWGDSFMSWISGSPYSRSIAYVVGKYHTGDSRVTMNANYVADGFGNYGMFGVLIEALVLAALLLAVRSSARRVPPVFGAVIIVTPLIALANSSPFTAVLSNGFLAAILIFVLFPSTTPWSGDQPSVSDVDRQ